VSIGSGAIPKVKITVETRAGNKTVSRVQGLEHFGISIDEFARECRKKFACSVSKYFCTYVTLVFLVRPEKFCR
jgi:translation initiation factor 1 (eIF-1/SUI1)